MDAERAEAACPACGGAGGGPLGRAGSAWDTEDYVCPRCDGRGIVLCQEAVPTSRPGVVKAPAPAVPLGRQVVGKA